MERRNRMRCLAAIGVLAVAACTDGAASSVGLDRAPTSAPTSTTAPPATTTTTAPVDLFALRPPDPAPDAQSLARRLVDAETTLRDPTADEVAVATAALAQQAGYRQLGTRPEWDAEVLASVPDGLRRSVELNAAARREFRAMHPKLPTVVPAWQIVPPPPADVLLGAYRDAEAAFGIPWQYLAAINLVETGLGRIRGTSTAGAQGPMQFMPATWEAYGGGGDVNDPHDAVMGAARYLAANNGGADIDHALWRYNHSDRYVRGVRLYAELIVEHPQAFAAYYHWGIWYITELGDLYLPVGYAETSAVPVADYLAR